MALKRSNSRRRQSVTPRASRRVTGSKSGGRFFSGSDGLGLIVGAFGRLAVLGATIVALALAYNAMAASSLFRVDRIDAGHIAPVLGVEIETVVKQAVGQATLLQLDLDVVRERVQSISRVSSATVARVLPDTLVVRVNERRPSLPVRRKSGAIVWLDEQGIELGDASEVQVETESGPGRVPPLAVGLSEGNRSTADQNEDRKRIELYKQIEQEFTAGDEPAWDLIDEVDLTYTKFVNLRIANSHVTVQVGSKDFRNRFETALKILNAIRRGDSELLGRFRIQEAERLIQNPDSIEFIDTARPDRPVLNFSMPRSQKPVQQEANRR